VVLGGTGVAQPTYLMVCMVTNEAPAQAAPSVPPRDAKREGGPCKSILVVEDDGGIRETLKYALELEGYKVFTAANGRIAVDLLPKISKPCLILLDLMMPEMNGWEFVDAIEKDKELAAIPVVVVTAFADRSRTIKSNGVIKKPVDLDVLYSVVKQWCGTGGENTKT
jgi:two-component system chemotaxis response regulator CheY